MKMKMSIIIGVIHMNLGILMSLFNNRYFRDRLSTITEFVPQVRSVCELCHGCCFIFRACPAGYQALCTEFFDKHSDKHPKHRGRGACHARSQV
jgi:hypothetical protein